MLVIAPLSANMLGKITNGLCDDLVSSVCRAWDTDGSIDGKRKRIVVCPAMNSAMYRSGFSLASGALSSSSAGC